MNEQQPDAMEVLAPSALHSLEKAHIDVQVSTAHAYPRSLEKFKKRAMSMALLDTDTAESCIYCREVGKEKNDRGQWVPKFAEGPSIRMAEIVSVSYENIRAESRIVEQTPRYVKCEGMCWDIETNVAMKSEIMESTVTKEGVPYSERQRALTAKVALSKSLRDAIFRVVPRALCKPIIDAAKKVASGEGKPIEERRKKAMAWVSSLKINEARVFSVLGVNGWTEVNDEQLIILTGLKTGIQDGDRIDEVFPPVDGASAPADAKSKAPQQPGQTKSTPAAAKTPEKTPEKKPEPTEQQKEEKALADAGLAPEKPQEPPKAPEPANQPEPVANVPQTAAEPAQQQQQGTPETSAEADPKWEPKSGDSDAWASLKLVARKSGVRYSQVLSWARVNKIAKENQSLEDLSENKLLTMANRFPTLLPKIKETKV